MNANPGDAPANAPLARPPAMAPFEHGVVPPVSDPLAETLQHLQMDGTFYCRSELSGPWGLHLDPMPGHLWFHVITSGRCTLVDHDGAPVDLGPGDVVVLPHGRGHRLYDDPRAETPSVFDLPHRYVSSRYAVLQHGGGGSPTGLVCGLVRLGHPGARPLLEMLPDVIRIDNRGHSRWQWLPGLLELMVAETSQPRPGSEAMVTRLCDILVIQAIRAWIDGAPEAAQGWLAALRDPVIGPAIALIHRSPERLWTVAELARSVGASRSAFSARFTELVGSPAKAYLTNWRMEVARDLLGSESIAIAELAARLGYGSEAAFSRAYKRVMGEAPSETRRLAAAAASAEPSPVHGGAGL